MDKTTQTHLANIYSQDGDLQNKAYNALMKATDTPVDWAYEAWDDLVAGLKHKDNHVRAIAAQLLSNLAKSDPRNRMQKTFPKLLEVTKDERFVTARHCLQSLWKIGVAGRKQQKMVVYGLAGRFDECAAEKNCTLIRYDICQSLRNIYDEVKDESIREKAVSLIETEPDLKYRKKYSTLWKAK
jgi:HEAT repeat protein